jgi:hypothetical protein
MQTSQVGSRAFLDENQHLEQLAGKLHRLADSRAPKGGNRGFVPEKGTRILVYRRLA